MNKLSFCLAFFLLSGTSTQVFSAVPSSTEPQRDRVALVLSGGGARGLAHIGVLHALEEMRVPVDCVVGTSMGALVGGIYAAGVSPEEMRRAITETDIAALFDDTPPRSEIEQNIKRDDYQPLFGFNIGFNNGDISLPPGVSAGYKFELFLKRLIGSGASVSATAFDELPTPYRAIASDLVSGELKVFSHGELPRVMRASMSLPGIVAPTEIDGRLYVDGGLVDNLPVAIGRKLCGEKLIVVNLGTPPKTREQIHNSIDVAMQSINILTQQNVAASLQELKADDILIVPDLEGFDSAGFSSQDKIIERGEQSVRVNQSALSGLVLSEQEYLEWQAQRNSNKHPPVEITAIHASDTGAISAQAVLRDLHVQTGEDFDIKQLNRDIVDLYGRGDFSYVGYQITPLEEDENQAAVDIRAVRKPWGPGYLKLGLGAATDFSSPTQLNLALSYRKTWVNALGAEWRTDMQIGYDSFLRTEFIQPLQFRDGAFISPYAGVRRNFIQFYQGENRIGQFTLKRADAGIDFGLTGFKGELRLGPYIRQIKSEPDFGLLTAALSPEEIKETGIVLKGILDQLDSYNFPRSGVLLRGEVLTTKKSWGSDSEYTQATAGIIAAMSFGRNTVQGQYHWGDAIGGPDEISIPFKLGGLMRLSGLYLDQLTGTHFDLATVSYYRQYASLPSQLGRGMYLGMSLETGRIDDSINKDPFEWINAGSIFWGADTILGRIYIGYGRADIGQHSWYLEIGPQF